MKTRVLFVLVLFLVFISAAHAQDTVGSPVGGKGKPLNLSPDPTVNQYLQNASSDVSYIGPTVHEDNLLVTVLGTTENGWQVVASIDGTALGLVVASQKNLALSGIDRSAAPTVILTDGTVFDASERIIMSWDDGYSCSYYPYQSSGYQGPFCISKESLENIQEYVIGSSHGGIHMAFTGRVWETADSVVAIFTYNDPPTQWVIKVRSKNDLRGIWATVIASIEKGKLPDTPTLTHVDREQPATVVLTGTQIVADWPTEKIRCTFDTTFYEEPVCQ